MKPLVLGVLALLALAACSSTPPAASPTSQPTSATPATTSTQDPDSAIREVFDLYVTAVNAKNRDTALELISSSAFARFDELRKHAMTSTEDQLAAALPAGPRATVHVLRARPTPPSSAPARATASCRS